MSKTKTQNTSAAYSVIRTDDRGLLTQELIEEATRPGAQRARFIAKLAELDSDDYAICVKYNRTVSSINKYGETPVEYIDDEVTIRAEKPEIGVNPKLRAYLPGAAPANKMIGDLTVPCGVCLVIGGGGSGKTPLAHALASYGVDEYAIVRVGEPLAGYTSDNGTAAKSLAMAILTHDNIVLDSIKDLLSAGGSAMKSGISREALVSISGWAVAACEAGSTIYVPVNPSTKDPDVLELLIEISKSNATMTVASLGNQWKYWTRQGEGLERNEGELSLSFHNGVSRIATKGTERQISPTGRKPVSAVISIEAMSQATRRSIVD